MREKIAVLAATLVAPLVTGLIFAVWGGWVAKTDLNEFATLMGIGCAFSLIAEVFVGLPVFLVLRKASLNRPWVAALVGFLVGSFLGVAFVHQGASSPRFSAWVDGSIHNLLAMGVTGAITGFAFWFTWRIVRDPARI